MRGYREAALAAVICLAGAGGAAAKSRDVDIIGKFPTVNEVRKGFEEGAARVRYRDVSTTAEQRRELTDPQFLRRMADAIPTGHKGELEVRSVEKGGERLGLWLERGKNDMLRLRIDGAKFATEAEAKELVDKLEQDFDRIHIRGKDELGRRVRVSGTSEDRMREAPGKKESEKKGRETERTREWNRRQGSMY